MFSADRQKILVVEDELLVARSYERALRRLGCILTIAETVKRAERLLQETPFDGIVLDLDLGTERGESLLPAVEALKAPPPVVVASGALDGERTAVLVMYGVFCIPKPASPFAIWHALAAARPRRHEQHVISFCVRNSLDLEQSKTLLMACSGAATTEIAQKLECTPAQVGAFWQQIFGKTGCTTKSGVISLVLREAFDY